MAKSCRPDSSARGDAACSVEAVLPIDGRGQIVIPKDVREKAHIRVGDKLALVSWAKNGETCCLSLIRADDLSPNVAGVLHSIIGGDEE